MPNKYRHTATEGWWLLEPTCPVSCVLQPPRAPRCGATRLRRSRLAQGMERAAQHPELSLRPCSGLFSHSLWVPDS